MLNNRRFDKIEQKKIELWVTLDFIEPMVYL